VDYAPIFPEYNKEEDKFFNTEDLSPKITKFVILPLFFIILHQP
jgi:hypothetical protein